MKIIQICFLIIPIFLSCRTNIHSIQKRDLSPTSNDSSSEKNLVDISNLECKEQINKAHSDIAIGNLSYTHMYGEVLMYRSDIEMDSLLSKYQISSRNTLVYCTRPDEEQNCYGKEMEKEIQRKYGNNFIDSLRHLAEISYAIKYVNEIYSHKECDTIPFYPNIAKYYEFEIKCENDFFSETEYPEQFKYFSGGEYSTSRIIFFLNKFGSISDIKIKTTFQNPKNNRFKKYYNRNLKAFLLKTKWAPATYKGIKVNCEVDLTFTYK